MKTKIIPFDLETAKKIQAGEIEGRIVTNHDMVVTLVDAQYGFDEEYWIPIIWHWSTEHNELVLYNSKGECKNSHNNCYLHIELPEETPNHEFKPFDKVLVRGGRSTSVQERNIWVPAYYQYHDLPRFVGDDEIYFASGLYWRECIPYEGNQKLLGTTNKPKED